MKKREIFLLVFLLSLGSLFFSQNNNSYKQKKQDISNLKTSFLGQPPPGMVPEIFSPGIVSTKFRDHSDLLFHPNGKEIYWSVAYDQKTCAIVVAKMENQRWQKPRIATFSSPEYFDCIPSLSADGSRLYFSSMRPIETIKGKSKGKLDIWYVNRIGRHWSEPKPLNSVINHSDHDSNPLIARNGNLYFGSDRPGGNGSWDIYFSLYSDGKFGQPQNLGNGINTDRIEICSYIDPDERFILFSSYDRPGGYGNGDIYISYRQKDGSWAQARNLGKKINTEFEEAFGTFSPDGKYFFFGSDRNGNFDVYWVDSKVILLFSGEDKVPGEKIPPPGGSRNSTGGKFI